MLGSPFLQGHRFLRQTPDQLAGNFGRHFVQALQAEPAELGWLGPITSAYGIHYLWLIQFEPARDPELHEVKQQLQADLGYVAKKQGLQCAIGKLRSEYVVQGGAVFEEACK